MTEIEREQQKGSLQISLQLETRCDTLSTLPQNVKKTSIPRKRDRERQRNGGRSDGKREKQRGLGEENNIFFFQNNTVSPQEQRRYTEVCRQKNTIQHILISELAQKTFDSLKKKKKKEKKSPLQL